MMNEKLFETYQDDILVLFKQHYKKIAAKNANVKYQDVFLATMDELGFFGMDSDQPFLKDWFHKINSLSFVNDLIKKDKNQNEIIIHSSERVQILFHDRREEIIIKNLDKEDYQMAFEILALRNNITWNYAEPFASFSVSLEGIDFRATLIHYSTSANRMSKVFLRAIKNEKPGLDLFHLQEDVCQLIKNLIYDRKNILISGSTGSGKTTFLRALLKETDINDHTVIMEDTHEILPTSPNQTTMLAQNDLQKKSLKDYCAYALRMSPDRLIVGEMRSTEVVPFMLAMNTGHRGLMSTIHANSCVDAMSRIALLFSLYSDNKELDFSLITKLACRNIDYVIHMENKSIKEIARIIGSENENVFYETIFSRD